MRRVRGTTVCPAAGAREKLCSPDKASLLSLHISVLRQSLCSQTTLQAFNTEKLCP